MFILRAFIHRKYLNMYALLYLTIRLNPQFKIDIFKAFWRLP